MLIDSSYGPDTIGVNVICPVQQSPGAIVSGGSLQEFDNAKLVSSERLMAETCRSADPSLQKVSSKGAGEFPTVTFPKSYVAIPFSISKLGPVGPPSDPPPPPPPQPTRIKINKKTKLHPDERTLLFFINNLLYCGKKFIT
jgi:hypothetical protein